MDLFSRIDIAEIISTIVYTALGLGLFIVSWLIIEALTPFSLRREVEEEHNLAIAVLMGAIFLSLAILISAVILS
ncbi:MAG: DUF350 domain-containing protein [Pseudomonadota bacterium]